MFKQILFMITAGMLAVVVTGSAHATPFRDVAVPEMVDEAPAGLELPTDR